MIKELIEQEVKQGRTPTAQSMVELSDIMDNMLCIVNKYDTQAYKKYVREIHGKILGEHFNKELAKEIVSEMKQGTVSGEYWNENAVSAVYSEYASKLKGYNVWDLYVALNSFYVDMITTKLMQKKELPLRKAALTTNKKT